MAGTVYDEVLARRTVSPAVRTNGTVNGAAVDLGQGSGGGTYEASVVIVAGTITDGSHAVAIEDSDDGSTGWAAIPAGQLQGSPPTVVAANDDTQFEIGIAQCKRHVRVSITTTGATSGGAIAAAVLVGHRRSSPIR
jgi:hypothetical protein